MGTADRIVKAFFALEDSMDVQQKAQCEQNGYTFARKAQIEKLLRDQGKRTEPTEVQPNFNYSGRPVETARIGGVRNVRPNE